jgi:hypothetical protein
MMPAAAERENPGEVGESELLDVLYEVLAQGVAPGSPLTTAEVEQFLHEHARSPKSLADMLAFFERHGLPRTPGEYGADPELSELASGLHRERGPRSGLLALDTEAPLAVPPPDESGPIQKALPATAPSTPLVDDATQRTRLAAPARTPRWLSFGALALGLLSLIGFGLSLQRGDQLEGELKRARLQLRATDDALTALERRAEGLRGALAQTEAERAELSQRFESFSAETARLRAAEEDVLRRMLGKRYDSLRSQYLSAPPSTRADPRASNPSTP